MPESAPLSVLVVEDDETHRSLVTDCLARSQPRITPVFATTCGEALERLSEQTYDCVVVDHSLPDGKGSDLLHEARRHLLTTPVVAFSTSVDPEVILEECKGGCIDFVPKRDAFRNGTLARTIVSAVERHRTRAVVERCGSSARLVSEAAQLLDFDEEAPRSTEHALLEQVQLIYETAVRTIQDGVLLVERRSRVLFANPGFKRLIGLADVLDLPGHPLTTIDDVFTPDGARLLREPREGRGRYESSLRAVDGTEIPVLIGESPLGEHGLICAVSDLREIKLQQRELEMKNRRLAELNETANRFVDNVSHEFRTPLTVIKGYAEVLSNGLAGAVSDQQRECLATILDRTRDLAQMVDDLLDTSKLRAGCLRVDRRPTDLREVFRHARPAIDQKAHATRTHIKCTIDDNIPPIYVDAEKVGRVILNLVVNAIKFSEEGGTVSIRAERTSEDDVTISVTDRGPGISPENVKVVFDRFRQVGNPQRSSTKGFGLGLNIANELVAMNLGTMHVTSVLGKGSTFSFTVPVHHPLHVARRLIERVIPDHEKPVFVSLLRACTDDGSPRGHDLLNFLSSHTYPMDLIFVPAMEDSIILFGVTTNPDKWARRLLELRNEYARSPDEANHSIDVIIEGRWNPDTSSQQAISALELSLQGGYDYVAPCVDCG